MKTKRILSVAAIAALTMVLTSCISLKATITLDAEARASGSMTISMNKGLASFLGMTSAGSFKEELESDDSDLPRGSQIEVSESDTEYNATVSFEDAVLDDDEFGAKVLENGDVQFTFVNEGNEATEGEDDLFSDIDTGSVTVTVNFPGEVKEFSGEGATQVDSDTVMWEFPFQTSTTATARSGVSDVSLTPTSGEGSSSTNSAALVVAGLAVIAAVVFGGVLLSRHREQVPATSNQPMDPGTQQPMDPATQQPVDPGPQDPTT